MSPPSTPSPRPFGEVCETLTSELHNKGVLVVSFNAPDRLNALDQAMKRDLIELATRVQMDDAVRVLVFTGVGRAFCAGDYLTAYHEAAPASVGRIGAGHTTPIGTASALRVFSQALNQAIRSLDKPTIAAINGPAIQAGLSLALCCDFRIGSTAARLGSATLRFGLLPDEGGHFLLVQHLGLPKALEFLMRKRIVDAEEALTLGLLGQVVTPPSLMPTAMDLAAELADGAQVAMRMLKRSLYNAAESTFTHALDEIAARTAVTDYHPDAQDGASAFLEKRLPRFNGWLDEGGGSEGH
jgi:2-(1,2-epoxy-1,2-dihydrophenyl)acetyl-CoA isomerase